MGVKTLLLLALSAITFDAALALYFQHLGFNEYPRTFHPCPHNLALALLSQEAGNKK
jgi:hypothetical protein